MIGKCLSRWNAQISVGPIQMRVRIYHEESNSLLVLEQSTNIPSCYAPFSNVFCPKRVTQLLPHQPWDCVIDLKPGEPVPRGKIYPLSIPEQKVMKEYIEEALQQGYICLIQVPC